MPTVLRIGGYTFVFYAIDRTEPAHVHVRGQRGRAKFWLDAIVLAKHRNFRDHELNEIAKLIREHQAFLLRRWHETFGR